MIDFIYVLYEGYSEDGTGHPKYKTFTLNKAVARKFYYDYKDNPYSISKVIVLTKDKEILVTFNNEEILDD